MTVMRMATPRDPIPVTVDTLGGTRSADACIKGFHVRLGKGFLHTAELSLDISR